MIEEITHADLLSRIQRLETVVWALLGLNIPQVGMILI